MQDAEDPRALVHAALLAPSPLERYRAGPTRRAIHGDVLLVAGPDFRHVLVLGPAAPERVFALARTFFEPASGFSVEVEVESAGAMERELRARNWRLDEDEPALVLLDIPAKPPSGPADLCICPVTDGAGLAAFQEVSAASVCHVPSLAAATDPAVALFVGYVAGQPVATARLTCLGRVAEIMGVTTASEFQRRGYGTALTWAAIAEGARHGCTAAMLTATAMGYRVYLRMGFRPVCTYRTYLPPDEPFVIEA